MINEQDSFIEDIDTSSFVEKVIKESKNLAVIVDFWAPWCEPCKQITPVLKQLAVQYQGKVKLVKINIDDNQEEIVMFSGKTLKEASEDYLTINPVVTEMLKNSPKELKEEILEALIIKFSDFHEDHGLVFPSATWIVTAKK